MNRLLFTTFLVAFLIVPAVSANAKAAVPIKILLVPGHDNEVWGAEYGNMKEANMTLVLARKIYDILKKDKRFEVHITRDGSTPSSYTKEFADYFTNNRSSILTFKEGAKAKTKSEVANGSFVKKSSPPHLAVSEEVSIELFGINKWANENKMDAVVHIHFNDYPRPTKWTIGKYKGFTVYFPDGQLANWKESSLLAADIFTELRKKYGTSTYPPEKGGLIPDQSLIALGANGTLFESVRSVLIEYSYIYEKKFRTISARTQSYKDMANFTATGLKNYFFPK